MGKNQDDPDIAPPHDAPRLGRVLLVVSPAALADAPALADFQPLCVGADDPCQSVRAALRGECPPWDTDVDTIVVVAECEPVFTSSAAGGIYRAVDFINALGDSPLIGVHPSGHASFFIDMESPFIHLPPTPDRTAFHEVILAGWQAGIEVDEADRQWLKSTGAGILSSYGVSEAIAARATGKQCMALFYIRGDRESARSLLESLRQLGIFPSTSFVCTS